MTSEASFNEIAEILSKPSIPLCVFVGSGISSSCRAPSGNRPPSWENMVKFLEQFLGVPSTDDANFPLRLEEVLFDLREDEEGSRRVTEELRKQVNGSLNDLVAPGPVHEALTALNPNIIITTNFDDVLERALISEAEDSQGYNVWAYPDRVLTKATQLSQDHPGWSNVSLGDLLKSDLPLIAKIHGSLAHDPSLGHASGDRLKNLVLTESDYRDAYDQSEISPFLRAVFSTHQVLFIGYSLNDGEVRRVLSDLNTIRSSNLPHIFFQRGESVVSKRFTQYYRKRYGMAIASLSEWKELAEALRLIAAIRSGGGRPNFTLL